MIYTLTMNPSIDYVMETSDFEIGKTNKSTNEYYNVGGKGINVSIVLKRLETNNTVLGFVGGTNGQKILDKLNKEKINCNLTQIEDETRINIKIKSNLETELNAKGPTIKPDEFKQIMHNIENIKKDQYLVIAGSIPKGINENVYEDIAKLCKKNKIKFVVDATKKILLNTLKHNPFLIKPNHQEIEELFGVKINTEDDLIKYGKKLQHIGAKNVLISLGSNGAILITETNKIFKANTAKGVLKNSVGAGDSMIAGFLANWIKTFDYKKALISASAAGAATAFSKFLTTKEEKEKYEKQINIKE